MAIFIRELNGVHVNLLSNRSYTKKNEALYEFFNDQRSCTIIDSYSNTFTRKMYFDEAKD
jgi:hypothetical protein